MQRRWPAQARHVGDTSRAVNTPCGNRALEAIEIEWLARDPRRMQPVFDDVASCDAVRSRRARSHGDQTPPSLFFMQWPVPAHVSLLLQPGAHVPLQPLSPHSRLSQLGVHTHWPPPLQVLFALQPGPHVPLQPSLPHSLPLQLGMHAHVPCAVHI
jgi:hypothetical protein